ncbi:MAG: DUF3419 family protein [Alphaproteobacteria bacterium]|nr:DUF3419 family protein [Alphaproteobacteria bacterium]
MQSDGLAVPATFRNVKNAVRRSRPLSREGIQERLFTFLFSGLVYAQIWEDPAVDLEALALEPGARIVTIASGGCNALAYLAADPAFVLAVDLNGHHIALNRLKIAALTTLPDHSSYFRFLGASGESGNPEIYALHLREKLDPATRAYWDRRDWRGRRRIDIFARNIYRTGLLGRFIAAGHLLARLHGRDPRRMLEARDAAEQRRIFETEIRPVLRSPVLRALVRNPASLYGLGIPPAQYRELLGSAPDGGSMADVLETRLERLACDFPIDSNYFAWQAFGRRYPDIGARALPAHLLAGNFEPFRARAGRIELRHANLIDVLEGARASSFDAFVLLDAQDWMDDATLCRLWRAIRRAARPGARVIFRTAAEPSLLPGRLPADMLADWDYARETSAALGRRDRSAIYGGFHLYRLRGAAPR